MAGYVPRTGAQKKREILAKRLRELDGACFRKAPREEVSQIIEKVRTAQLGVLKCMRYELDAGKGGHPIEATLKNVEKQQEWWDHASHVDIVGFFGSELRHVPDLDGVDNGGIRPTEEKPG